VRLNLKGNRANQIGDQKEGSAYQLPAFINHPPSSLQRPGFLPLAHCSTSSALPILPFPRRAPQRDLFILNMDKITDKWQGYLNERFPQGEGGKPTVFKCPECSAELKDIEAWRQHIASHPQHQQSQSAKKIYAFNQSAQAYAPLFPCPCLYCRFLTIL
jgi:hypothetical protein